MADEKSRMEMDPWMPFDPALPKKGKLPKKNGVGTGRKIKSRPHFSELGRLKDQKIGKSENQKMERLRNGKLGGSENRNAEYQNQNTVRFPAVAFCQLAFQPPESGLSFTGTSSDRIKRVQKE